MSTAAQTYRQAEDELRAGQFEAALLSYMKVMRGVPDYWRARFRIADVLLNFKKHRQAYEIYKSIAGYALRSGQPLNALLAIKMAALMDPTMKETLGLLAELYSRNSSRVEQTADATSKHRILKLTEPAGEVTETGDDLLAAAATEAADVDGLPPPTGNLPPIPLFSFLEENAFEGVLNSLQLRRFVDGQAIISEGEAGDSFFILVEGSVSVTRQGADGRSLNLAQLRPGAVFGEMALISNAPRSATVTAQGDCDLVELKRSELEAQAHQLASVTQALRQFTQERFLNNLTATSAIFKPFPRSVRNEIVKRFQEFPVDPGDELIGEGEEGQGLFLILKGNVRVTKQDSGEDIQLAVLKEGDVFGEISLIQDQPTTATCTAKSRGQLLFLPKREFNSVVARHPEMRDELHKITQDRIEKTKNALEPPELITDDDLILL
ncbi:MAG: cyclic nucleotide-binding domain-containing protein [Myxococcota bacterium]